MSTHFNCKKRFLFQAIQYRQTVLNQPNHFRMSIVFSTDSYMSKQFYFKQFSLALVRILVLFDPSVKLSQVLQLWVRVGLGAIAIKGVLCTPKSSSITGTSP